MHQMKFHKISDNISQVPCLDTTDLRPPEAAKDFVNWKLQSPNLT